MQRCLQTQRQRQMSDLSVIQRDSVHGKTRKRVEESKRRNSGAATIRLLTHQLIERKWGADTFLLFVVMYDRKKKQSLGFRTVCLTQEV